MNINLSTPMKVGLGAAAAGLVGGFVAERLVSPQFIEKAEAHDRWRPGFDDYVSRFPVPDGTSVRVVSTPEWTGEAIVGGVGAALGIAGGVTLLRKPTSPIVGYGAVAAAGLGAGALAGSLASYALRG